MTFKAIATFLSLAAVTSSAQAKLRNLQSTSSGTNNVCTFQGQTRQPGQWLQGSSQTCMCDRNGSGNWVNCQPNSGGQGTAQSNSNGSSTCTRSTGETRQPGQWYMGTSETCMCDRYGSGQWVSCTSNTSSHAPSSSGPNLETALGRLQQFQAKDFTYDLEGTKPQALSHGGSIQEATVGQMPALAHMGVSLILFTLEPCGMILPHEHPQAAEFIYVISGGEKQLRTAFVESDKGAVIMNDIGQGMTSLFPRGLIHLEQNLGCEPITFLGGFSSEDPGLVTLPTELYELPEEALEQALGEPKNVVEQLMSSLPTMPAEGRQQCMSRCGIPYSS